MYEKFNYLVTVLFTKLLHGTDNNTTFKIDYKYKSGICIFNVIMSPMVVQHTNMIKMQEEIILKLLNKILIKTISNYVIDTVKIIFEDNIIEGSFHVDDPVFDEFVFLCDD
jgi:hypothetical protein